MSERRERSFRVGAQKQDSSDKTLQSADLPSDDRSALAAALSSEGQDDVETRPPTLPRQTDFSFIHHAENAAQGKSDADDLPTIRSHAMRNVRRERRLRDEESKETLSLVQKQTAKSTLPTSGEAQLNPHTSHEHPSTNYLPDNPLSENSPYTNTSALSYLLRYTTPHPTSLDGAQDTTLRSNNGVVLDQLVPGVTQYLQYFIANFGASLDPRHAHIPVIFAQIAVAEGDAALLHTVCYISTAHQALVRGIDIQTDWSMLDDADRSVLVALVQYKDKALSLLKNGFSDPLQACTDTSILTVSLFLIAESFFADENSIAVHAKGLGQMVEQRGGREVVPHEVYHYVVMADVKISVLSLSTPSFSLTRRMSSLFVEAETEFLSRQASRSTSTGFNFLQQPLSSLIDQDMMKCCHFLYYLIDIIEGSYHSSTEPPNLRTHFSVLEHQLLFLSVKNAIAACCRLALILYCNVALWSWPKASSLIQSLLDHLKQAINSCGPQLHEPNHSDMLIWCLLLASFASKDDEIQFFFMSHLQDLLSRRGIGSLSQVRSVLPGYFYADRVSEEHLRSMNTKLKLVDDLDYHEASEEKTIISHGT